MRPLCENEYQDGCNHAVEREPGEPGLADDGYHHPAGEKAGDEGGQETGDKARQGQAAAQGRLAGQSIDKVQQLLADEFVTIELMVDDKHHLPQPRYVVENGHQVELATYGDLWSYLQRHKFGANSQPYYVVLDPQGRLLSGPFAYKESVTEFIHFLKDGLNKK